MRVFLSSKNIPHISVMGGKSYSHNVFHLGRLPAVINNISVKTLKALWTSTLNMSQASSLYFYIAIVRFNSKRFFSCALSAQSHLSRLATIILWSRKEPFPIEEPHLLLVGTIIKATCPHAGKTTAYSSLNPFRFIWWTWNVLVSLLKRLEKATITMYVSPFDLQRKVSMFL